MSEHDETRALLAAYALDAVDADERRQVEALVARDPQAARELDGLRAVAARLGQGVATEPPAALRASVLAAVAGTPQLEADGRTAPTPADARPPADATPTDATPTDATPTDATPRDATSATAVVAGSGTHARARSTRRAPSWFALAAAVLVGAAVPTAVAIQQAQRAATVQEQQTALGDLLTDPSAVVVHSDVTGGGTATAVLTDTRALFSADGLPDPGEGSVYQLWVVDGTQVDSAGVLSADGGSVQELTESFAPGAALAITVEPAGGSPQPTTDPLVVLTTA